MKKKLCKEKSDSSVRLKNRDDINLKTLFYGTSLNIILGFWLITLTVQLYFFIATLKIWVSYNLEWLHTLCILIHLLMQPSGVWWVTKTDFISPKNINTKHFQDRGHNGTSLARTVTTMFSSKTFNDLTESIIHSHRRFIHVRRFTSVH